MKYFYFLLIAFFFSCAHSAHSKVVNSETGDSTYIVRLSDSAIVWPFKMNGGASSPIIYKNNIYLGTMGGEVYAIDLKLNKLIWYAKISKSMLDRVVLDNNFLYFPSNSYVYCVNQKDGKLNWRFRTRSQTLTELIIKKGKVFFAGVDSTIYCLNASTGGLLWKYKNGDDTGMNLFGKDDDISYWASDGTISTFDLSGKLLRQLKTHILPGLSSIYDSIIYFQSPGDRIKAENISSRMKGRELLWQSVSLEPTITPPILYKGKVFVGTLEGSVVAIDSTNGDTKWVFRADNRIVSDLQLIGNKLLTMTKDSLYLLNSSNGKSLLKIKNPAEPGVIPPMAYHNFLFISLKDSCIHKINIKK
jgi:outer membrane protein assembly factor BamB